MEAQEPARFELSPLPSTPAVGSTFTLTVRALDASGEWLTNDTSAIRLKEFVKHPEPPVISEVSSWGQVVEVINPGDQPFDLSDWELVVGREESVAGFVEHARLRFPAGTVLNGGAAVTWAGTGQAPGAFPAWVSGEPFIQESYMFSVVQLLDPMGAASDEVFLVSSQYPASLSLWQGVGLKYVSFDSSNVVHSRFGDVNHFRNLDWTTNAPASLGQSNPGLLLPWTDQGNWYLATPSSVVLSNGVWSGEVSLPAAGDRVILVVDNLQGLMTRSETVRVEDWPQLTLIVPESLRSRTESVPGFAGQAFVSLPAPRSTNVLVTLEWSAPGEFASLPSVTLLAGQTHAGFSVTNLDDAVGDGDAQITLRASAAGFLPTSTTMWNTDDESCALWLELPGALNEGHGLAPGAGRIWLESPARHDVLVTLSAQPPLEVPATTLIPMGAYSGQFDIRVQEDDRANPIPWQVPVSASSGNGPIVEAQQALLDNESRWLTVVAPAEVVEGAPAQGIVRLAAARTVPLKVRISAPDWQSPVPLDLPIEVVVPAGALEQQFPLRVTENTQAEPGMRVELYASWENFAENTGTYVLALDDDAPLTGLDLSVPQSVFSGHPVIGRARLVTPFGTTFRTNTTGQLAVLALPSVAQVSSGSATIQFTNGVWEGPVTMLGEGLGLQLHLQTGGLEQVSSRFDLLRGGELTVAFSDLQWWSAGQKLLVLETASTNQPVRLTEFTPLTGDTRPKS